MTNKKYKIIKFIDNEFELEVNVAITIYTLPSATIKDIEIEMFKKKHQIEVIKTSLVHDKFMIIDEDIYSIVSSLKDAGSKLITIHKLDFQINLILNNFK